LRRAGPLARAAGERSGNTRCFRAHRDGVVVLVLVRARTGAVPHCDAPSATRGPAS